MKKGILIILICILIIAIGTSFLFINISKKSPTNENLSEEADTKEEISNTTGISSGDQIRIPVIEIEELPNEIDANFSFQDYVVDEDNNSLYDYLVIEFETNFSINESYTITSRLVGEKGSLRITKRLEKGEDKKIIQLKFDGFDIYGEKMEGKFKLRNFKIENNSNRTYIEEPIYYTSNYSYKDFENVFELFDCRSLTKKNIKYVLQNNISSNKTCFNIMKTGIVLDLNGYNVTGVIKGYGVYIKSTSNTILNGTISNFETGFYLDMTNGNIIENCSINYNQGRGIYFFGGYNNKIINNKFYHNKKGIDLDGSDGNLILRNDIKKNSNGGINVLFSHNNQIIENAIKDNLYIALYLNVASYNLIKNNTIGGNEFWGIYASGASSQAQWNNTIVQNNISRNGNAGIIFTGANITYSNISNNIIFHNFKGGIELNGGNNNNITKNIIQGNIISGNKRAAIYIEDVKNNIITGNIIKDNLCAFNIIKSNFGNNDISNNIYENNWQNVSSYCKSSYY